jgi:hypothetical protein
MYGSKTLSALTTLAAHSPVPACLRGVADHGVVLRLCDRLAMIRLGADVCARLLQIHVAPRIDSSGAEGVRSKRVWRSAVRHSATIAAEAGATANEKAVGKQGKDISSFRLSDGRSGRLADMGVD